MGRRRTTRRSAGQPVLFALEPETYVCLPTLNPEAELKHFRLQFV